MNAAPAPDVIGAPQATSDATPPRPAPGLGDTAIDPALSEAAAEPPALATVSGGDPEIRPAPRPPERAVQKVEQKIEPAASSTAPGKAAPAKSVAAAKSEAESAAAPGAPALSAAAEGKLMTGWGVKIRARIDRAKSYPRAERAAGVTGTVMLRVSVPPSGQVVAVAVARSSGNAALDEAAVKAVRKAGRLPKAPKGLAEASYQFKLPVAFTA